MEILPHLKLLNTTGTTTTTRNYFMDTRMKFDITPYSYILISVINRAPN